MSSNSYDLAIIGAGINGVGIAECAAAAGYRVLVIERKGVGSETSCRSSKLIHGGLRYLESGQIGLVKKALRARRTLLKIAPDLVHPVPFVFPVYQHSKRAPWILGTGLALYGVLAGLDPLAKFRRVAETEWDQLDGLMFDDLAAVFQYWDAQTDDQLLTRSVMESAQRCGAELLCPVAVEKVTFKQNRYQITMDSGEQLETSVVVNSAGPWVNEVLACVVPEVKPVPIHWVQGAHIELTGPVPKQIYYLESPGDGRVVFVMPWQDRIMVGTTETQYEQLPEHIEATPQEVDYLLNVYRHYFPLHKVSLVSSWAGLRVLPAMNDNPFSRPRDTWLQSSPNHPNMLNVYGGKLTTYRDTAIRAVKWCRSRLGLRPEVADYQTLKLVPPEDAIS
ncbi:FAD-dependent oxidoreductase [Corallincola platygyrae]|uniref:FAD-dependent oxidoreductase n=1 Tax=Corallincola platygyrae TaxID=1193278 RepID=A0ABW4XK81_9GAMM